MPAERFAHRPWWPEDDIERHETVVVVGAGPSLTVRQIRAIAMARLKGEVRVIAVNDAIWPLWGVADWLHACDFKWWQWHPAAWRFEGIKTTLHDGGMATTWGALYVETSGEVGYDGRVGYVRHGSNGGYQAVHLAAAAGAQRILMVGIDCRVVEKGRGGLVVGQSHYFGEHPDGMAPAADWPRIGKKFETLVEPFAELGIEVINCAPGSSVEAFPFADLEDVL